MTEGSLFVSVDSIIELESTIKSSVIYSGSSLGRIPMYDINGTLMRDINGVTMYAIGFVTGDGFDSIMELEIIIESL